MRNRNVLTILSALLSAERSGPPERDETSRSAIDVAEYRRTGGCRYDLAAWLGHPPSASEQASYSRTLRRMEAAGLLKRLNWAFGNGRTTHCRLTPEGRRLAEQAERPEPRPEAPAAATSEPRKGEA